MRRWPLLASAAALGVAGACGPKPDEPRRASGPSVRIVDTATALKGRVRAHDTDLVFEPCGGGAARTLVGRTELLRQLVGELGSAEPTGAVMFAVLYARDATTPPSALELLDVIHAAPEGRGCAIDWSSFLARALGNEPFWSIDVLDDSLVLRRPDQADRLLPLEASPDPPGTFEARDAAGAVTLDLTLAPCRDGMSGAWFAWTAEARVDGESLHGCAMAPLPLRKLPPRPG